MKAVKRVLSVLGTAIICAIALALMGVVVLFLTMKIGARIIFVMDGTFILFLIVKAVIKKVKKSAV